MRRIGWGGHCPNCDEPVTIDELLNTPPVTHSDQPTIAVTPNPKPDNPTTINNGTPHTQNT